MSLLKRLMTLGKAEGNALVNKLEDPVKMIDQGINDLRRDQEKAMQALAEVKAGLIRTRRELDASTHRAGDLEAKAKSILMRAKNGELDQGEADRLATDALRLAKQERENATRLRGDVETQQTLVDRLQGQINTIRSQIAKYETEARSLKARQKTAESVKKFNRQFSQVDSSNTISMLERMRDKVNEEEALAEAYTEMAAQGNKVEDEIDRAAQGATDSVDDELAKLKASL